MAFYYCSRIASKSLLTNVRKFPNYVSVARYAAPNMTTEKFTPQKEESYDDKNARLKRPMSPHLTIYAPQLTSMLSITHRIAGVALSMYFMVLGTGSLILPHDVNHYITMIEGLNLSGFTIFFLKFCLAAPFSYHLANGFRHLYWDAGKGFSLKEVYSSGYAMCGVAGVLLTIMMLL